MTSTTRSIVGAFLILICTLSLAFILSHYTGPMGWKDFTANQRYSLTDGTKNILKKLHRPLEAKLFFSQTTIDRVASDQLKQFISAHVYVRDLLAAFQRESAGKLKFAEYDPKTFSDAAEEAAALGVQIQPVLGTYTFAFGLAVTSDTGAKEVIPFINAQEQGLFEYKVTKLIERASRPAKKKIGVVSGLPVLGDNLSREMRRIYEVQGRPVREKWFFAQWLERDYEIEQIEPTAMRIPDGIDYLLAIHPKDFSDQILYAIDQYVMRGGKLIALADPFCNSDQPPPNPQNPYAQYTHLRASDFNRLTNAWGVAMEKDKILGDKALAIMQANVLHLPYVMFKGGNDCFNASEVITQGLDKTASVLMIHAGVLSKVKGSTNDVTALISSTATGGTRKYGTMEFMKFRQDPDGLWDPGDPTATDEAGKEGFELASAPVAAAVRISGKLKSAFPAGLPGDPPVGEDPDKATREKVKKEHLTECKESNNVILIADVDILSDDFISNPRSPFGSQLQNQAVLHNTLDYLAGSSDLISIRSRGSARRDLAYILEIRRRAAEKTKDKQRAIQKEIDEFQTVITNLQSQATKKTQGIANAEALKKKREANLEILKKERELNDVRRDSTIEEEAVMFWAKLSNTLGLPALVALIGLILWIIRIMKRTRQMQEDMA